MKVGRISTLSKSLGFYFLFKDRILTFKIPDVISLDLIQSGSIDMIVPHKIDLFKINNVFFDLLDLIIDIPYTSLDQLLSLKAVVLSF